ncbi:MAG: hypothetical protein P8P74_05040 [Crocinitomicaceae bacterium]|nr:hypothetical protein [Crocinitomicaceae bacterium]
MEEDEDQRKIDLKQHALNPVSKKYLLRIILYVVLLVGLCYVVFYLYKREPKPTPVKNPKDVKEIRGVTLSDSI